MIAGYPHWRCVTTESAGVPTGGKYGRVRWFEAELNRMGLKLAWSRMYCAFGIYSQRGPGRYVWQMNLWNFDWGKRRTTPKLLEESLLFLVLYAWRRHCQMSSATIKESLQQMSRDYVREIVDLRMKAARDPALVKDVGDENWRASGRETRPAFSVGRNPLRRRGLGTMDN